MLQAITPVCSEECPECSINGWTRLGEYVTFVSVASRIQYKLNISRTIVIHSVNTLILNRIWSAMFIKLWQNAD